MVIVATCRIKQNTITQEQEQEYRELKLVTSIKGDLSQPTVGRHNVRDAVVANSVK
jgi:hypothetical protein